MTNPESKPKVLESPDELMQMVFGFWAIRAFLTAFDLGVFTALGDDRQTADEVARAIGADARATDRLLNAMCAIGLMVKEEGRFANTPLGRRILVKGRPQYMAGIQHSVHLWESWSTLTEAVKRGTAVAVAGDVNERGATWLTAFISAMHGRAMAAAPGVVALLDLSNVSRVLDVGGGSGAYSMAFVRAKEGVRATVFDLPNVVSMTRQYVAQAGLSDKVDTIVGDYNVNEFGVGFDLVSFSAIIHSNTPAQNIAMMRKTARALRPGGQVVIQDFIMDEDRTTPAFGALFALNMLVGAPGGDTFTESEVRSWLEQTGFTIIERKDTKAGTTLIIGRKR
jgi:ubiquinone/menaquinone biosynthesis C-methylase UbiE